MSATNIWEMITGARDRSGSNNAVLYREGSDSGVPTSVIARVDRLLSINIRFNLQRPAVMPPSGHLLCRAQTSSTPGVVQEMLCSTNMTQNNSGERLGSRVGLVPDHRGERMGPDAPARRGNGFADREEMS